MKQDIYLSNGKIVTLSDSPYAGKLLARVRSTFRGGWHGNEYTPGFSRPTATHSPDFDPDDPNKNWTKGLPGTIQYHGANNTENVDVILNEEIQWWIYGINASQVPDWPEDQKKKSFTSLMSDGRMWTNYAGSSTHACYPCGTNLNADPMIGLTLTTSNAILEMADNVTHQIFGEDCYPFFCINASIPFDHYDPSTHPFLFFRPVNEVRTPIFDANGKWTGKYKEDGYGKFPQFDNKVILPLLMQNSNVGWINKKCVDFIDTTKPLPPVFNM